MLSGVQLSPSLFCYLYNAAIAETPKTVFSHHAILMSQKEWYACWVEWFSDTLYGWVIDLVLYIVGLEINYFSVWTKRESLSFLLLGNLLIMFSIDRLIVLSLKCQKIIYYNIISQRPQLHLQFASFVEPKDIQFTIKDKEKQQIFTFEKQQMFGSTD